MGTFIRDKDGRLTFETTTRSPSTVVLNMRTVTDPDEALALCRELVDSMRDHEVVFYQP